MSILFIYKIDTFIVWFQMTDKDIINEFNNLNHPHNKFAWFLFHSNQEIKDYIHNRYNDSNSDKESLQRILYHIEYQGFWTHNDFPYNSKNDKCNKILENWKEKSLNDNFFKSAINCWTISDVNKRNIAKENKLNWIEFFHYDIDLIIKEIENYILELKNNYIGIKTIL